MGRGAWHPRRQDQLGRHSHRAGEGSRGQGANELKLEAVTPKSHPPPSAQVVVSTCASSSWCHAELPQLPSAEPQQRWPQLLRSAPPPLAPALPWLYVGLAEAKV